MKRLLCLTFLILCWACARPAAAAPTLGLYSTGVNSCCVRLCNDTFCTHYRLGFTFCCYVGGCGECKPPSKPPSPRCISAPLVVSAGSLDRCYGSCLAGSRWIVPSYCCGGPQYFCDPGTYTYSTTFTVPCGVTEVKFTGCSYADDMAYFYVNCCLEGGSNADGSGSCDWNINTPICFTAVVHPGTTNSLTFLVPNQLYGTGLDVSITAQPASSAAPEIQAKTLPLAALLGVLAVVGERRRRA